MRLRSTNRRPAQSDSSIPGTNFGIFQQTVTPLRSSRRRRDSLDSQHSRESPNDARSISEEPQIPTIPSSRLLSSDAVLRNTAVAAIFLSLGLLFLNFALYVAVILTAVVIPAWRTFKTLERPAPVVEVIEIDDEVVPVPVLPDDSDLTAIHATGISHKTHSDALCVWHKYWVLVAVIFALNSVILHPFIFSMFPVPLYRSALLWLFVWLNTSYGANAAVVYDSFIRPLFLRSEHTVDVVVTSVLGHVDYISRHIILGVSRAVEPYARQLEHAAEVTRRQMAEQARRNHVPRNYFN